MELKQPATPDSEHTQSSKHSKNRPGHKPGQANLSLTQNQKSLREDWERTLAQKEHIDGEVDLKRDVSEELHLPIEAQEVHDGIELDKPDPVWEPWQAKLSDSKPPVIESKPQPTSYEAPLQETPDPDMAAEARLKAKAVTEHADFSAMPEYKDQLPKEAQDIIDQLQPPEGHRFDQSVWHNIEVDAKGKVAEHPTFDYGEAFKDEQKAETNPLNIDDPGVVAAASGQLAVSSPLNADRNDAAVLNDTNQPDSYSVPMERYESSRGSSTSNIDPLLWIILIVIIFAIFLAIFI